MKDWTSLLLQAKTNCGAESTAEEVLKQFLPFVEATASAVHSSVASVLASALFTALSKRKSEIEDSVDLSKVHCVEQTASKSGALDAVSDDCLKKALTFVSDKDRRESVERVCHRLFHCSRNAAVYFPTLSSVSISLWRRHMRRLCATHWNGGSYVLAFLCSKPSLMTRLKANISCATVSPLSVANIGTAHFPQLSEARLKEITVSQATAFLSLNTSVNRLSLTRMVGDSADDASQTQLFVAVSKLKNVRSLELKQNFGKFQIGDECDFSHITQLTLDCNGNNSAVPFTALMHDKLKSLSLKTCCIPNATSAYFPLFSLKRLSLRNCGCDFCNTSPLCFDTFCAPLLEDFSVVANLSDFAHYLAKCPAKRLTLCVKNPVSVAGAEEKWNEALEIACEKGTLQSLRVVLWVTKAIGFEPRFLNWLARSLRKATFAVELHASARTWLKISSGLGLQRSATKALKDIKAKTLYRELVPLTAVAYRSSEDSSEDSTLFTL